MQFSLHPGRMHGRFLPVLLLLLRGLLRTEIRLHRPADLLLATAADCRLFARSLPASNGSADQPELESQPEVEEFVDEGSRLVERHA
jgi:hypothetical protein